MSSAAPQPIGAAVVLAACCALSMLLPGRALACDGTTELRASHFQLLPGTGDPPRPPAWDAAGGALAPAVALPDRLGRRVPHAQGVAWYRLRVARPRGHGLCGLLLPHAHGNAVVYVNGEWLGQNGRFAAPAANAWNRPLYLAFPASRLGRDVNFIDVGVLASGSVFNGLDHVLLGADSALRRRYERLHLLRIGAAEASTVVSLGVIVLFAAFGFALRESTYLLLALAAAGFGVNSLNFHLREPPIDSWAFNSLVNAAVAIMASALTVLVLRLLELPWRRIERAVWGFALTVVITALLLPGPEFERLLLLAHVPAAVMCLCALVLIAVHRRRLAVVERRIYLVTSLLMVAIGVHDVSVHAQKQLGRIALDAVHLLPYLGPVMLLGFGSALIARFLRVYRRAERANQELQQQIAEKHSELEQNFARMREFERQRVLGEERERLMREMHDGIGGHLVAMLAMTERGGARTEDLAEALRDALDDMRLVIHSLQPSAADIAGTLADMRARLEPRLSRHGLRFQWAVSDLPAELKLGPSEVLQALRIVQESIANALKHAQARTVRVATGTREASGDRHAFIEIADDGRGMNGHAEGRGLPNMRVRAARLGGALEVESSASGTTVRLTIPVERRA